MGENDYSMIDPTQTGKMESWLPLTAMSKTGWSNFG